VRRLIARTPRPVIPDTTAELFRSALALADAGRDVDADSLLSQVIVARPAWAVAYLDRALVRARSGRTSAARADLELFLTLAPDDRDADAARAWLARTAAAPRTYSAGTAFALGLVPGAGHFYTKRPVAGTALLLVAGGAAAFGLLYQQNHVVCLTFPVNGRCPPDQVRGERMERPYLMAAAGAAAAITVLGAVDAARGARSRNERAASALGAAWPVRVRADRVDVALLRVRF
jgi:hypothetical protein